MLERETILREFWKRMSAVTGVAYTARNPKKPPSINSLPAIQIFEFTDRVLGTSQRGGYPIYKRRMTVVAESFISASKEGASSAEIMAFLLLLKKSLYADGGTLGGLCSLRETETSRVLRPATGGNVSGVGVSFELDYVEDTSLAVA
jgi:hypothetical protein